MPPIDPDAIARAMIKASAKRIAEADAAEKRSQMAFRTGRMEEYWFGQGKEAEERFHAEYIKTNTDTGSGGTGGGSESDDSVSSDGGDDSHEPPEEGLPPATGA